MNPAQQLENIKKQALDLQGKVSTMKTAETKSGGAVNSVQEAEKINTSGYNSLKDMSIALSPVTTPDGTVAAETLTSGGTPDLPEPTADTTQETFQNGLTEQATLARTELESTLKAERDAALKRQEELNKKMEKLMQNQDPTKRDTFAQEERIVQNQLDAAETASASLEEDFAKRRKTVNELDTLLTQGNQLIEQARNAPITKYRSRSVSQEMQNVQARAGVLQAVVSGLDGNINFAHSIINNASNAVASVWNDQLTYNQAYMSLVESGELAKNKIQDDYANSQIVLAEQKLNQLEETKSYIQGLMIDPASAQFIADAGITLNDSVEEINTKMQEQTSKQEREDTINELTIDGYEYVPFAEGRDDVVTLEVGGKTLSFVPPSDDGELLSPSEAKTLGVPYGTTKGGAYGVTAGGVVTGANGVTVSNAPPGMSDYDKNILTARVGKQIYGTKISDAEGKRVESFIKAGMEQGKSELEIMDDVLGFKVERNQALSENLRNTLLSVAGEDGLAGFDMLGLARLINNGSDAQAVQRVEQIVYDRAKQVESESYIGEFSAKYAVEKGKKVRALIDSMNAEGADVKSGFLGIGQTSTEAPIGVVKGTMENWLGRFRGEDATALRSTITNMVAEMRNRLSGTAVTDSEAAFLEPLIPSLSDSPANFIKKLEQLESDPLLRLNTIRTSFNLPTLTDKTLLDNQARVGLYSKGDPMGLFSNQPVKDEINPGGI